MLLLARSAGATAADKASPGPPETQPQAPPSQKAIPQRIAAPAGSKHHLFLYLFDGMAATEMPVAGYERMTVPRLTDLMAVGMTYTVSYSVSPWTVPAVASLMTSLYPSAHTLQKAGDRLPASAHTLAEIMKEHGYETALFSSHPLVGPLSGLDQGFDRIEEIPGPFGSSSPEGPGETSSTLNRKILAWLDGRSSTSPTFVVALSSDPLEPFGAPPPEGRAFIQDDEYQWYSQVRRQLLKVRPGNLGLATQAELRKLKVDPDRFARAARKVYDGALLYNDRQLSKLTQELQARGYWKNALFVVTSTHGEEFGERGGFGHGASLADTALRVPWIMSYPPVVTTAVQMHRTCDLVDLLPTVLSLLGFPVPEGVQGIERNVEPTLETRRTHNRAAFAETSPAGELPTGKATMISEAGTKLIIHDEPPAGVEVPSMEFFRGGGPGWEKKNMLMVAPEVALGRREILDGWRQAKGKPQIAPDGAVPPPDPKLKEILRSLGYLQGMAPSKGGKP